MQFRCIHVFISVSVFSPDVKVNFYGLLAVPECHSISLLPPRHHCTIDGMAALNETTNHRQQLKGGRDREQRGREQGREERGRREGGRGGREWVRGERGGDGGRSIRSTAHQQLY